MSKEKLVDLNDQLDGQINRIKQMNRTASETQETTNNIMKELGDQGEKIGRQINIVIYAL